MVWCSEYVNGGKFKRNVFMEVIVKCLCCRSMLSCMVIVILEFFFFMLSGRCEFFYGGNNYFDDDLFCVMENFVNLIEKKVIFFV